MVHRIPHCPAGFRISPAVLGRLLKKLGIRDTVDILGLSWGGALAHSSRSKTQTGAGG